MGSTSLAGMLEYGDVDNVLRWHLSSNHYPPLPGGIYAIAKKAIELANDGQWEALVDLGEVCSFRGSNKAPVSECIQAWHLDQFIQQEEYNC